MNQGLGDGGFLPADKLTNIAYQKIADVHANLEAIRKVADRLTPVADFVEFRTQIEEIYAQLDALTEAADLMLAATPVGIALLTAVDVAAARFALQLGTAALLNADTIASQGQVDAMAATLSAVVSDLGAAITFLGTRAAQDDLDAATDILSSLVLRVADLEAAVGTPGGGGGGGGGTIGDIIFEINGRLEALIETVQTMNYSLVELTNSVEEVDGRITTVNTLVTNLTTDIETLDGQVQIHADTLVTLGQRVNVTEEGITALVEDTTALQLTVNDLNAGVLAAVEALDALTIRVQTSEESVSLIGTRTSALEANVELLNTGQEANAVAIDELGIRVEQVNDDLLIEATRVTQLRAALRNAGNLLANTGFESGVAPWTVTNRGTGWLTAQLALDLRPSEFLPPNTHTLGITVPGLPSGNVSISSGLVTVEEGKTYYLSGYLTGDNATVRLEYRFKNAANADLSSGVVATAAAAGMTMGAWNRQSIRVVAPAGATTLILMVWITAATDIGPYAILLRPMVEEAWADQEGPSPWVEGASGIGEIVASATQELVARITDAEDEIDALSAAVTELEATVGDVTSDAFAALTARVTATENENTAQSSDIVQLQSDLGGLEGETDANAAALSALTTRVSAAEGELTAQADDITDLNVGLNNIGSDNMLPNSSFEDMITSTRPRHWSVPANAEGSGAVVPLTITQADSPLFASIKALRIEGSSWPATRYSSILFYNLDGIPNAKIVPGQRVTLSTYARGTATCEFRMYLEFLNSGGSVIQTEMLPATNLSETVFNRLVLISAPAPVGTVAVRAYAGRLFGNGGNCWYEVDNTMMQIGSVATAYMPSAMLNAEANAAATQSLTARVTAAENEIDASSTSITSLTSRIDGNVGGNRLFNPAFQQGNYNGWDGSHGLTGSYSPRLGGYHVYGTPGAGTRYIASQLSKQSWNVVNVGDVHTYSVSVNCDGPWRLTIQYYNDAGTSLANYDSPDYPTTGGAWVRKALTSGPAPADATWFVVVLFGTNTTTHLRIFHPKMELGSFATPYSEEANVSANSAATTALEARTTAAENTLTTYGTAITNVQATLGGGGNILPGSAFESSGLNGWVASDNTSGLTVDPRTGAHDGVLPGDPNVYIPRGARAFLINVTGTPPAGSVIQYHSPNIPVRIGQKYITSFWLNSYRCNIRFYLVFFDVSNNVLDNPSDTAAATTQINPRFDSLTRHQIARVAPAGAVYARVYFCIEATGEINPFAWFIRPMLEEVPGSKTEPSVWNAPTIGVDAKYASATNALDARVTSAEGTVSSTATAVTNVRAEIGSGGNLLTNTAFEVDIAGWILQDAPGGWAGGGALERNTVGDTWRPINMNNIGKYGGGSPTSGEILSIRSDIYPATEGKRYMFSAWIAAHRATAFVQIIFLNAEETVALGTVTSSVGNINSVVNNGGQNLNNWNFCHTTNDAGAVAPVGTRKVYVRVLGQGTSQAYPYLWMVRPMLEEVGPMQTMPSTWSSGSGGIDTKFASVTNTLSVRATSLENGQTTLLARYAVRLDVNGYQIGWELNNNGSTGTTKFRSDLFEISSPSGGARLEWSNGHQRIYDAGGVMRVRLGVWP